MSCCGTEGVCYRGGNTFDMQGKRLILLVSGAGVKGLLGVGGGRNRMPRRVKSRETVIPSSGVFQRDLRARPTSAF